MRTHTKVIKLYPCETCKKTFQREFSFRKHLEQHERERKTCTSCKLVCEDVDSLTKHKEENKCIKRRPKKTKAAKEPSKSPELSLEIKVEPDVEDNKDYNTDTDCEEKTVKVEFVDINDIRSSDSEN